MKKSISAVLLPLIIVGLILPLTAVLSAPQRQATTPARIGMLIRPGTPAALGAQLAVNEINASGNVRDPNGLVYMLELVYPRTFPTQTEELRATIEQLSAEGVIAILGPSENTITL